MSKFQSCLGIKFSSLRTMTSGRGQFSMEFKNYMPCPNSVSETVIEKVRAEKEAAKKK